MLLSDQFEILRDLKFNLLVDYSFAVTGITRNDEPKYLRHIFSIK